MSWLEGCVEDGGRQVDPGEESLEERRSPLMEGATEKREQPLRVSFMFSFKWYGICVGGKAWC